MLPEARVPTAREPSALLTERGKVLGQFVKSRDFFKGIRDGQIFRKRVAFLLLGEPVLDRGDLAGIR
jgi:hypothetical protein